MCFAALFADMGGGGGTVQGQSITVNVSSEASTGHLADVMASMSMAGEVVAGDDGKNAQIGSVHICADILRTLLQMMIC